MKCDFAKWMQIAFGGGLKCDCIQIFGWMIWLLSLNF